MTHFILPSSPDPGAAIFGPNGGKLIVPGGKGGGDGTGEGAGGGVLGAGTAGGGEVGVGGSEQSGMIPHV